MKRTNLFLMVALSFCYLLSFAEYGNKQGYKNPATEDLDMNDYNIDDAGNITGVDIQASGALSCSVLIASTSITLPDDVTVNHNLTVTEQTSTEHLVVTGTSTLAGAVSCGSTVDGRDISADWTTVMSSFNTVDTNISAIESDITTKYNQTLSSFNIVETDIDNNYNTMMSSFNLVDTNKFDKSGGTITGDTTFNHNLSVTEQTSTEHLIVTSTSSFDGNLVACGGINVSTITACSPLHVISEELIVKGTGTITNINIKNENASSGSRLKFTTPNDYGFYMGVNDSVGHWLSFGCTGDGNLLTLDNTSNRVGINCLAGSTLEVNGSLDVNTTSNFDGNMVGGHNLSVTEQTSTEHLIVTSTSTFGGGAIFNEDSADVDFRFESNGNANMLFVDGGSDLVGIGCAPAGYTLDVLSANDVEELTRMWGNDADFVRAIIDNRGSGDSQLGFGSGGSTKWSIGNDSTAHSFKISEGYGAFGTDDHFIIDTAGQISIGGIVSVSSSIIVSGADGNVTANKFIGDGSLLTDVVINSDNITVANQIQTNTLIVTSTSTFGGAIGLYSRTEAELKSITPTAAGQVYYDSTNLAVIVSTGTSEAAFGLITDGTSQPTGWD